MTKVAIRDCNRSDLKSIVLIENASFDDPYPYEIFHTLLASASTMFRVAEFEGKIVGYFVLKLVKKFYRNTSKALIVSVAVDPNFRGLGIGSLLLEDAVRFSKDLSSRVELIELQVGKENLSAQALYKKFQFKEVRIIPDYYGARKDAILMEVRLS